MALAKFCNMFGGGKEKRDGYARARVDPNVAQSSVVIVLTFSSCGAITSVWVRLAKSSAHQIKYSLTKASAAISFVTGKEVLNFHIISFNVPRIELMKNFYEPSGLTFTIRKKSSCSIFPSTTSVVAFTICTTIFIKFSCASFAHAAVPSSIKLNITLIHSAGCFESAQIACGEIYTSFRSAAKVQIES